MPYWFLLAGSVRLGAVIAAFVRYVRNKLKAVVQQAGEIALIRPNADNAEVSQEH